MEARRDTAWENYIVHAPPLAVVGALRQAVKTTTTCVRAASEEAAGLKCVESGAPRDGLDHRPAAIRSGSRVSLGTNVTVRLESMIEGRRDISDSQASRVKCHVQH